MDWGGFCFDTEKKMASQVTHVPLDNMVLELNPIQSSFVTWVYQWSNVDLTSRNEL